MEVPSYGYPLVYLFVSLGFFINLVGYPVLIFTRNNSKIARARSIFLLTIQWLAFNMQLIVILMNFVPQPTMYPYLELIFWKVIFPQSGVVLAFRALKQIMIYFLGKRGEDDFYDNEIPGEGAANRTLYRRFIDLFPPLKEQIQDRHLMKVYFIVHFITIIPALISVVRLYHVRYSSDEADFDDPVINAWNYISGVIGVLFDVIFIIILWKIRDGFYLKKELMIMAISGVLGLMAFTLTFNPKLEWVGYLLVIIITDCINFASFGYIPIMAVLEYIENNNSIQSSSIDSTLEESKTDIEKSKVQNLKRSSSIPLEDMVIPVFKENPFIYNLINNEKGKAFLISYLRYYQYYAYINIFGLIRSILEFKKSSEVELFGKGVILFQKYLREKEDREAPFLVAYNEEDIHLFQKYNKIGEDWMENKVSATDNISNTFFDEILTYYENLVNVNIVHHLKKSPEYGKYSEINVYNTILDVIVN